MADKIDWSILGESKRGLAVEGKDDQKVVEAFLSAGERQGLWTNWRAQIEVVEAGSRENVLKELRRGDSRIWGLIDRDWRPDAEIHRLQEDYPQLLVLPRVTIENYCIDPGELEAMLPAGVLTKLPDLRQSVDSLRDPWVLNGALWQVMYESGAFDFCRGHEEGYPMAVLHKPIVDETQLIKTLDKWRSQLEPSMVIGDYRDRIARLKADPANHYRRHIHGKNFFHQVVVAKVLRVIAQRAEDTWFGDLFSDWFVERCDCPPDMVDLLKRVVT